MVNNAEFLSGAALVQLAHPGAQVIHGGGPTAMYMNSGAYASNSPEAMLLRSCQGHMADFYGVPAWYGAGATTAKEPGIQSAYENALAMFMAYANGADVTFGTGLLDGSRILCLENMVVDDEIIGMVKRILTGIEVSEETLAVDLIKKMGFNGNYLFDNHTRAHVRELWQAQARRDRQLRRLEERRREEHDREGAGEGRARSSPPTRAAFPADLGAEFDAIIAARQRGSGTVAKYGGQSMIAPLRRVLVRRPDAAFAVDDPALWHYAGRPHLPTAQHKHDTLVSIMRAAGVDVAYHDVALPAHADAVFVFDPVLVTDQGAVLLSMGKELRRGEEAAMAAVLARLGVPLLYSLHGEARAEGGDLLWLDHDTLAVGQGFRTNDEGLRQLREALKPLGARVLGLDLPFDGGPQACLHLLSLISLVDDDLAVVFEPLLPVPLWQELRRRGIRLLRVPEARVQTHDGHQRARSGATPLPDAGGQRL